MCQACEHLPPSRWKGHVILPCSASARTSCHKEKQNHLWCLPLLLLPPSSFPCHNILGFVLKPPSIQTPNVAGSRPVSIAPLGAAGGRLAVGDEEEEEAWTGPCVGCCSWEACEWRILPGTGNGAERRSVASLSIGKWTLSCIVLLCWDHLLCSPVLHGVKYLPEGWKAEGLVDSFPTAAFEPAPLEGHKAFPAWHRCFFCLVGKKWVRRR